MLPSRKNSSVMLLTLAEFAWLLVFGVLLLLKGKDDELSKALTERDKARQANTDTLALQEKFDDLTKRAGRMDHDLTNLLAALNGASVKEAQVLLEQGRKLPANLAATEERLSRAQRELDSTRKQLIEQREFLNSLPPDINELSKRANQMKKALDDASADSARLRDENSKMAAAAFARERSEFSVRREITGLPEGHLRRVIILFDTSSSMTGSSAWEDAKRLVRVWLTYLPIEECVLITFNSDVSTYPPEGFIRLRGDDGAVLTHNQTLLLQELATARFGTYTDTLKAFQAAYRFQGANLILLFTDGKPKTQFASFESMAPQIYTLVQRHPNIPILAVGLGDYENLESDDKKAGRNLQIQFLKRLAQLSKGSFMGR